MTIKMNISQVSNVLILSRPDLLEIPVSTHITYLQEFLHQKIQRCKDWIYIDSVVINHISIDPTINSMLN